MAFLKSINKSFESPAAVLVNYPDQALHIGALTEHIMRSDKCRFSLKEREMIAAFTSGLNDCTFCYNSHKETAMAYGLEESFLTSLIEDIESSSVEEKFKPVFRYVKKLTLTPSRLIQADVDAILDAGWDENDFHFVVSICALFNFYNRLMDGYGVVNIPEFWNGIGQQLAQKGYDVSTWPTIPK